MPQGRYRNSTTFLGENPSRTPLKIDKNGSRDTLQRRRRKCHGDHELSRCEAGTSRDRTHPVRTRMGACRRIRMSERPHSIDPSRPPQSLGVPCLRVYHGLPRPALPSRSILTCDSPGIPGLYCYLTISSPGPPGYAKGDSPPLRQRPHRIREVPITDRSRGTGTANAGRSAPGAEALPREHGSSR